MTREAARQRREQIANAVEKGKDTATVAKAFGVSIQLVRRAHREFGEPRSLRRSPCNKGLLKAEIIADLRGGKSPDQVAKRHGISVRRIHKVQSAVVSGVPSRKSE